MGSTLFSSGRISRNTWLVLIVLALVYGHVHGEIRNGYEPGIRATRASLQKLKLRLAAGNPLSFSEKREINSKISHLISAISYYELTRELLERLRIMSPGIYNEMNCLTDKKGRPTDIFIRLIPRERARIPLDAASFVVRAAGDEDASISEFGIHSVSVDIWLSERALLMICHELGHIRYIVPHLAAYAQFYRGAYTRVKDLRTIGHHPRDPSGKSARDFEIRYLADYFEYRRNGGSRPESVVSTINRIRKKNKDLRRELVPDEHRPPQERIHDTITHIYDYKKKEVKVVRVKTIVNSNTR